MAHVSLIVTCTREDSPSPAELAAARGALLEAGYSVEVVVARTLAADSRRASSSPTDDASGLEPNIEVVSDEPGRAALAFTGLQAARGDLLLVLDPDRGHAVSELLRVLAELNPARPEVVVASRLADEPGMSPVVLPKAWIGKVLRRFTGSSDPLSGLVGLTRPALAAALPRFEAVGSHFTLELLAKAQGRRSDIPARPSSKRLGRRRPCLDDVRHLKHLADYRFGNASRLLQFCAVGASGMVVDLTCYALFQEIFFRVPILASHTVPPTRVSWALALARGLAIGVALIWNFSLNRRMTFSYARGGSIFRQFVAYVLSNLLGVTVSMLLSLGLPSRVQFFQDHKLMAAVVGIVSATGISFSMSRWLVFRRVAASPDPVPDAPRRLPERIRRSESSLAETTPIP